jgi:hypothetical protein
MDRLFDPGAVELADPRGDPNRVIEVQEKVEELLKANQQRREGIRQELLEQGAWALPGLMNASYVWMNELKTSPLDRKLLSSLMAELAADNSAAEQLLFQYGILETPFSTPRSIAKGALKKLDWSPDEHDLLELRKTLQRYREVDDTQTMLDLYGVLLSAQQEDDFRDALKVCRWWAERAMKPAGILLALLVEFFPERAVGILTEVFLAVKNRYNDKNLANMLLQHLDYPDAWLKDDVLLHVSENVLPDIGSGRHTAVEYLWINAVRNNKDRTSKRWLKLLQDFGERVRQYDQNDTIYRYWFEALGKAGEIEYLAQEARAETSDELWAEKAALQLFFQQRDNPLARQTLADLKREQPLRYERASRLFEKITGSRGKIDGRTEEGRRTALPS